MITSVTALAAKPIPAYCTSGTGIHTPAQWKQCWDIGGHLPTTTAANAGYFAGHNVGPFVIGALIILALIVLAGRRSGRPATN